MNNLQLRASLLRYELHLLEATVTLHICFSYRLTAIAAATQTRGAVHCSPAICAAEPGQTSHKFPRSHSRYVLERLPKQYVLDIFLVSYIRIELILTLLFRKSMCPYT
jgi:hypothetical protein